MSSSQNKNGFLQENILALLVLAYPKFMSKWQKKVTPENVLKSLQMVTAAMKLKVTYSLEGKL